MRNSSNSSGPSGNQSSSVLDWRDFLVSLEDASSVNDQAVVAGVAVDAAIACGALLLFILLRPHHVVYSTRLLDPGIRIKPPKIPSRNFKWIWAWLMPIFLVSEQDILDSAGLDALVFLRIIRMGIHFFLPVTLLAFVTLVPLHSTAGSWVNQTDVEFVSKAGGLRLFNSTTPFTSISMVQVPKGSNVLWVHVVFLHIVIAWACFLCYRNYLTFVVLRHNYVGRVLLPDEMESGQLKLRSCAECMHGWQSGFCGELISGSRDADLSTPEEHMELRPNPGDEDTAFRNPATCWRAG
uniref:Erd4-related membrane protein n=1 Tax=Tetraselmis sp. GSL018 TaxID=582737 RepID=A0A061R339_9CHLO